MHIKYIDIYSSPGDVDLGLSDSGLVLGNTRNLSCYDNFAIKPTKSFTCDTQKGISNASNSNRKSVPSAIGLTDSGALLPADSR